MVGGGVLAFLAGVLSILSPCVLPILPVVLGAAIAQHRAGPLALAAGLALSFTAIGLFVATIGFSIGLDGGVFRLVGAAIMLGLGLVLVLPAMQTRLAVAGGSIGDFAQRRFGVFDDRGLRGQFFVGLLLGAVWSPCVGPTLGAASVLAAQGKDLPQVAFTMLAFGLGAAVPLLLLGLVSRQAMLRLRERLLSSGKWGKLALGGVLIAFGLMIATGLDKPLETLLVDASPPWLTALTTRF